MHVWPAIYKLHINVREIGDLANIM
jgi:hypothetical protein